MLLGLLFIVLLGPSYYYYWSLSLSLYIYIYIMITNTIIDISIIIIIELLVLLLLLLLRLWLKKLFPLPPCEASRDLGLRMKGLEEGCRAPRLRDALWAYLRGN